MNEHNDIDDTRLAVSDERIGQGVPFLHDELADPSLMETIPPGSTVRHRDVPFAPPRVRVRLTAYRPPASPAWAARIAGVAGEPPIWTQGCECPVRDPHAWYVPLPLGASVTGEVTGASAETALDALEARVRRAFAREALPERKPRD
jgi:hypothetical protein